MSGITFGSGTFIKIGDPIPELDVGGFTDEADEKTIKAINKAADATITIEMNLDKRVLWRLIYRRPQRWPVSNNWLKMHGYPMRRRGHR